MPNNFFFSYDLNGQQPTHAQMDQHVKKLGKCVHRVLETVWYVRTSKTQQELYEYVNSILSNNDGVLIIAASNCTFRNLLVPDASILDCWNA